MFIPQFLPGDTNKSSASFHTHSALSMCSYRAGLLGFTLRARHAIQTGRRESALHCPLPFSSSCRTYTWWLRHIFHLTKATVSTRSCHTTYTVSLLSVFSRSEHCTMSYGRSWCHISEATCWSKRRWWILTAGPGVSLRSCHWSRGSHDRKLISIYGLWVIVMHTVYIAYGIFHGVCMV